MTSTKGDLAKVFRVSDGGMLDCVLRDGRYVSVLVPLRMTTPAVVKGDIILISAQKSEYLMLKKYSDPEENIKDLFYSDSDDVPWEESSSHDEECEDEERGRYREER